MGTQQPVNQVLKGRKSRYKEQMHKLFGPKWKEKSRHHQIYNAPAPHDTQVCIKHQIR